MVRADLAKHQVRKETVSIDELGASPFGWLRCCRIVSTLARPASRRFLDPATDWRGKTQRFRTQTGVKDDALLRRTVRMPVESQRRQRQLLPLCYLPATHRAANFATFENSARHLAIGMFFAFELRIMPAKEADEVPQGGRGKECRRARIH